VRLVWELKTGVRARKFRVRKTLGAFLEGWRVGEPMTFARVVISLTMVLLTVPLTTVGQVDCGVISQVLRASNDPVLNAKIKRVCAPEGLERLSQRPLIHQYCSAEIQSRASQVIASTMRDCPELRYEMADKESQAEVCHQTAMKALRLLHLDAEPKWTMHLDAEPKLTTDDCQGAVGKARAATQHLR